MACMSASCPTVPAAFPFGGAAPSRPSQPCAAARPPASARRTLRAHDRCPLPLPPAFVPPAFAPTRLDQHRNRTSSLTRVYDSGSQLELIAATQLPSLFNSEGTTDSKDKRSDNKGPELEGVVSVARARCHRQRTLPPCAHLPPTAPQPQVHSPASAPAAPSMPAGDWALQQPLAPPLPLPDCRALGRRVCL